MVGKPDLLFIVDTNKEVLAVKEANKIGIPIVAVVDSNSNPEGIDYPIPGNDDAIRSIEFYCNAISDTITNNQRKSVGLNFAIPINQVIDIYSTLRSDGEIDRGFNTGATVMEIDEILMDMHRIKTKDGVIVSDVEKKYRKPNKNKEFHN